VTECFYFLLSRDEQPKKYKDYALKYAHALRALKRWTEGKEVIHRLLELSPSPPPSGFDESEIKEIRHEALQLLTEFLKEEHLEAGHPAAQRQQESLEVRFDAAVVLAD